MTNTAPDPRVRVEPPPPARGTAPGGALLAIAAAAWIGIVVWSLEMGNGPGTMGLELFAFVAMWCLMMTAMMLPSAARMTRRSSFAAGSVLVWALVGVPAFGAAVVAGWLADRHPTAATAAAVCIFAICGLYQLSAVKRASVVHCRRLLDPSIGSPGARAGVEFGAWCVACSWALMALFIPLGFMNVPAMVVVSVVVYTERFWFPARWFARVTGAAAVVCVAIVVVSPSFAIGLHHMPTT